MLLSLIFLSKTTHGRPLWRLSKDFTRSGIKVPKGFKTDLGSIPRLFYWLVAPSEIAEAAVIHDYLYTNKIGTRKEADAVLHKLAIPEVGKVRAWLVWAGVRIGGHSSWGT